MVEAKNEKNRERLPLLETENKTYCNCWNWTGYTNWKSDYKVTKLPI